MVQYFALWNGVEVRPWEPKTGLEQYKGSAWAPPFAGAHASGRAGHHFDHLRCSCPIWHALNFKVMPRVSYEHGILKVML